MLKKIIDGFEIFAEAFNCLLKEDDYFWNLINTGWYDEYIYPYDDNYFPSLSKERQLRLSQKVETIILSAEDFDCLMEKINSPPDPETVEKLKKFMNRKSPWEDQ
jgi:hypothetical protein